MLIEGARGPNLVRRPIPEDVDFQQLYPDPSLVKTIVIYNDTRSAQTEEDVVRGLNALDIRDIKHEKVPGRTNRDIMFDTQENVLYVFVRGIDEPRAYDLFNDN